MPRQPREFKPDYCYHVTTRCNNREFLLYRRECREVFLYAIKMALEKFEFKLYAICIMSNHVHYLLEPGTPDELPKIMHWLNWYTAMCFNQMLKRTGHFWEKRYYSSGFLTSDSARVLNTLRYIHANPKSAKMQRGFFYDFSNYGTHERLTDDGITQWHPAFLELGKTLEECAEKYRGFCQHYRSGAKPEKTRHWGSQLLNRIEMAGKQRQTNKKQLSPGQMKLLVTVDRCQVVKSAEIVEVAETFIAANAYPDSGSR